jgi:hypothetical protein
MDGLLDAPWNRVARQARYAAFLVCCRARVLAAEGDYQSALADLVVVRRFARHLFDGSSQLLAQSISIDAMALQCTEQILGAMPPHEPILTLLREQMASVSLISDELWSKFDDHFERSLWQWRMHPLGFPRVKDQLLTLVSISGRREPGNNPVLNDDELFDVIREPFVASLRSIHEILASDVSYEKTHGGLEQVANALREKCLAVPSGAASLGLYPSANLEGVPHLYNRKLAHRSHFNAILSAIEIYRAYAVTGQLPQDLPAGLPGDPYSRNAFEYEQTEEGFVLRGRITPTGQTEPWEYEFRVRHLVK